jgi:hypothetical protein
MSVRCKVGTTTLLVLLVSLTPALALAQATPKPADKVSYWGVTASFTPDWNIPSALTQKVVDQGGAISVSGSQFTFGVVRGRATGGEWGVTFLREPVKDGSSGHGSDSQCFSNGCFDTSTSFMTQGVRLTGVEAYIYKPFKTFSHRVQIGFDFGGGVGTLSGTLNEIQHGVTPTFNPQTQQTIGTATTTPVTKPVTDETGFKTVPLLHAGPSVAIIVGPAVKIRWEAGVVLPGVTFFKVSATILIGAR